MLLTWTLPFDLVATSGLQQSGTDQNGTYLSCIVIRKHTFVIPAQAGQKRVAR
jgi:hypothetical protein